MKPILTSGSYGIIPLKKEFPQNWTGKRLPDSEVLSYTGNLGSIVIQEVRAAHFLIRFFTFRLFHNMRFQTQMEKGWQSLISLKGDCDFSHQNHKLREGQFLLLNTTEDSLEIGFPAATECQLYYAACQPGIFREWEHLFPKLQLPETGRDFYVVTPPVPSRTSIIDAIWNQFNEQIESYLRLSHYHHKIKEIFFLQLAQVHHPFLGERPSPWERIQVAKVRDIILKDIRVHHSNEDLAEEVNMDRAALNKAFRLEYGMGMHEFLIYNRFRKAKELLLEGKTMKQVASATGYSRPSTFSFEFRKYFGYSPLDFQKGRIH